MRRRTKVLLFLAFVACSVVVGSVMIVRHYDANVERFGDPFAKLPEAGRPPKAPLGTSQTFLVLGSDSRISAGNPAQWAAGAQRTDAIMLVHLPADRRSVQVVAIPRDSWVEIPQHGRNKINAAFSLGGPALMVATVEHLTGVRIDHVVIADFTGFTKLTDTLGGVRLDQRQMNGVQALAYVRQRHGLPGADLARIQRQQTWMRAVANKLLTTTTLTNPVALNRRLNDVTQLLAVDDRLTGSRMRSTARSLRTVRGDDIDYVTAPVLRSGWEGKQQVLYLADADAELLWSRMRTT